MKTDLDPKTANDLLNNIFEACDREPSKVPVEELESKGRYKDRKHIILRFATFAILFIIVIPLLFSKPSVQVSQPDTDFQKRDTLIITLKTFVPGNSVSAALNNTPLKVTKTGNKMYQVAVTKNGTLKIQASSLNGQKVTKSIEISNIDNEKPNFVEAYTKSGKLLLKATDKISGINYENISGIKVLSYDSETGLLTCEIPEDVTTIVIPDCAGNQLKLLLTPAS